MTFVSLIRVPISHFIIITIIVTAVDTNRLTPACI